MWDAQWCSACFTSAPMTWRLPQTSLPPSTTAGAQSLNLPLQAAHRCAATTDNSFKECGCIGCGSSQALAAESQQVHRGRAPALRQLAAPAAAEGKRNRENNRGLRRCGGERGTGPEVLTPCAQTLRLMLEASLSGRIDCTALCAASSRSLRAGGAGAADSARGGGGGQRARRCAWRAPTRGSHTDSPKLPSTPCMAGPASLLTWR